MTKILFVGEFSKIATGYGKITGELVKRFHNAGYEVAELATFCPPNHPQLQNCPWKVYPNLPTNDRENEEYNSNPQNANGRWKFEKVLLDFMPTHVFGNGDPFFYEYQMHSAYRKYFNWVITAPVDGVPQHTQWIHIFDNAEGLTTYTNWGKEVLESYDLKVDGVTPPVASDDFFPINPQEVLKFKQQIGISQKVVGTIMRNQPRKLFDQLFRCFSKLLETKPNTVLYCHTTYPDAGWDFSELLIKHNIVSKVLFTYKCKTCNQAYPNFFQDLLTTCPFCKNVSSKMPDGNDSVDNQTLNKIINIFDVYIQLANREGFGIPQIEAAACDVPVITVNYAGMVDVIKNIGAYPINVKNYYLSYPMNMMEAVPPDNEIVNHLKKQIDKNEKGSGSFRRKYEQYYNSWDKTFNVYRDIIDNLPPKQWTKKPLQPIPQYEEMNISHEDYVKFLIVYVLNEPESLGSYLMSRMIRDLNAGITFGGICGNYFTESIDQKHYQPFNRKVAYDICLAKRKFNDHWQNQLNTKD